MDTNSTGMQLVSVAPLLNHTSPSNNGTKSAYSTNATHAATATTPSQTQSLQKQKESPGSRDGLQTSVDAMNDFVHSINNSLQFSIDEDTGKTVVKVVDLTTQEVIKQIPTEEAIAIAKALDKLRGLLIHQQV